MSDTEERQREVTRSQCHQFRQQLVLVRASEGSLWAKGEGLPAEPEPEDYMVRLRTWKIILTNAVQCRENI